MRRLITSLTVAALAVAGVVAAAPGTAAAAGTKDLAQVDVTGTTDQKPTVAFTAPFAASAIKSRVVNAGAGDKLAKGQTITFDYTIVDGRTGKELGSSFGSKPESTVLDKKQTAGAIVTGLVGTAVGSRTLIAVPPSEGLAANAAKNGAQGVKKNDTLLFVVDVRTAKETLTRATGEKVAPPAGLPKVTLAKDGKPTIKTPGGKAPTDLVVQPLIKGDGPVVTSGQTVTVHYTGVIWNTGKQFDSSWDRGTPAQFTIGTGSVIPGWDTGLVGQTVGSQVLLVVPPAQGYGAQGNPSGGIKGTDTLVFVVDVLDAS
ncbi:MAG TPA: FKBP-type peptidyl-prolyl cis-trans isomerase [Acidimicrobiia bacterium]